MTKKIIGISGSLRKGSYNTALLRVAQELLGDAGEIEIVSIDLPLLNTDLEIPEAVEVLKAKIGEADGVLIATPEYNYSPSGALKNALDWLSRPVYKSVFAHKKVGIWSSSMGGIGGARAQMHLRAVLSGMVADIFPHPDVTIGGVHNRFDEDLKLKDEGTREFLKRYIDAFVASL